MLWYSTVIAVGLVALVWSADRFVDGASAIAKRAGLTPMLIGLTIVSVGTSAPEILISIMSALADSGELAVGNALGPTSPMWGWCWVSPSCSAVLRWDEIPPGSTYPC